MTQIERLVEDYLAREDRSRSWFAKQMGLSDKTLSSWFRRGRRSPLPPGAVKAIARVTNIDYRTILDAALADSGYLPESAVVDMRDPGDPPDDDPVTVVEEDPVMPLEPSDEVVPAPAPR